MMRKEGRKVRKKDRRKEKKKKKNQLSISSYLQNQVKMMKSNGLLCG